jgi:hypothetical protein
LLTIHAVVLLISSPYNFATYDEPAHLAAGVAHWQIGDFRYYRVNPPLARMIAALPALAANPSTAYPVVRDRPGDRPEWGIAHTFAELNAQRFFELVCLARLAGVGWSVLGGWLIYRWASELFGQKAGCLSLIIWCFEPNILAHAQLATPDIAATVAGFAATYVFWRYLQTPTWQMASCAGLLLGIAQLTKFTLLILYAVWPLIWLVHLALVATSARLRMSLIHAGIMVGLSLFVINLGYCFRGFGRPIGDFPFVSRLFAGEPPVGRSFFDDGLSGNCFRGTLIGAVPSPLPADYVLGIDLQRRDFEELGRARPVYLCGVWQKDGWWYYYFYAITLKVPVGILLFALGSAALSVQRISAPDARFAEVVLWLPALSIFALVSTQTGVQYLRYALPMFPFVIVGIGKLACFFDRRRIFAASVIVGLLSWAIVSSLVTFPHQLSYFNELAGGPENGHDYLADCNIDWGQDLLTLRQWIGEHPEARPIHLAYFGSIDPRLVGLEFELPPPAPNRLFPEDVKYMETLGPHPGHFAVSVNFVRGISAPAADGKGGRRVIPLHEFEYFQYFRPIAKAGYSIFIYHITLEEANEVRRKFGLSPLPP